MTEAHRLPADHPARQNLNDEVHARPPELMQAPMRISYLVCYSGSTTSEEELQTIAELASMVGLTPPDNEIVHYRADLGPVRVKWERHTEFTRYTFLADGLPDDPFAEPAIGLVPQDWLASLPGSILHAAHVALLDAGGAPPEQERIAAEHFNGNLLVGAGIGSGAAIALTDFHIHEDGFSRLWVSNDCMTAPQAGRMIQRLLEIDTYRMLALLALPTARALWPFLSRCEQELVRITTALASQHDSDEPSMLNRLTRLQAEIESRHADNHYRFDAARAYYALVQRRTAELREERIQGLQTFREFTERRLAPAMDTCRAVAVRQASLSEGVARATQLLSTRVDMARREQNQAVLESMNRRARLQLRLQETVEVLSTVALTYYMVRLAGYASNGLNELGMSLNTNLIMAGSVPVVGLLAFLMIRRVRRMVVGSGESP